MGNGETFLLIVGIIFILSSTARTALQKTSFPPAIGYLVIGLTLNLINAEFDFFNESLKEHLHLFGELGLMLLLFRVGIGSDVKDLMQQLKKAVIYATSNFIVSSTFGFVTSYYLLGFDKVSALFIAAALSATSVGVTTAVWSEAGKLKTPAGSLLVDMAEIDDILGILAMIVLFTVGPKLASGADAGFTGEVVLATGQIVIKTALLVSICYTFARFLEPRLSRFAVAQDGSYMLLGALTIGVCAIISYVSFRFGFSIAVGSFFAGLAYSKDPNENNIESGLEFLFQLLVPFFFVGIAMAVDLTKLGGAMVPGLILSAAAILGKVIGVVAPAKLVKAHDRSLLLGVSMIPRAEIALVVMISGISMAGLAIPQEAYIGVVIVSICTCIVGPIWSNYLLRRTR